MNSEHSVQQSSRFIESWLIRERRGEGTTDCVNDVDDETSHCNDLTRNICRQTRLNTTNMARPLLCAAKKQTGFVHSRPQTHTDV